ncbi:MAG: response regulator [Polyangiaceae bacterium]
MSACWTRTVLLVDDSAVARRAVTKRLESEGFRVEEESSLAAAKTADVRGLTCAILDVELADGTGIDLAAVMRGKLGSLPIAFFTAGAAPALLERAHSLGPVFRKPHLDELVAWAKRAGQPPPTK